MRRTLSCALGGKLSRRRLVGFLSLPPRCGRENARVTGFAFACSPLGGRERGRMGWLVARMLQASITIAVVKKRLTSILMDLSRG